MKKSLTIGFLARAADVNLETIRYYQRFGLINEPVKPLDGYRIYPPETVDRLRFIKRAKQLGFSLKEITELLDLGEGRCDDIRIRAETKRAHVNEQIKDLNKLKNTLDTLIKSCQTEIGIARCPIVETLINN